MSRIQLGPIVGHTDHEASIVWIQVGGDPADYELRVREGGVFPFVSTEDPAQKLEFGTARAFAGGLRPDWEYSYHVLRRKRQVAGSEGTFRTMPLPGSMADLLFISTSCSSGTDLGAWPLLDQYVKSAKPHFIIMMGDQIYADEDDHVAPAVWQKFLTASPAKRRQAIAAKYRENWSREPVRTILANTPIYMMWDDHEIRNGWGSYAPDSPTLAAMYPKGTAIAKQYNAYFEDCRDLYWHFQACRNPPPPAALGFPPPGSRNGLPFLFLCGRLLVIVLDDRGARDIWRDKNPVLGDDQWTFLKPALSSISADVDALALVVPLPLVSMAPQGVSQTTYGNRTDDVDKFKKGDAQGLLDLLHPPNPDKGFFNQLATLSSGIIGASFGSFKLDALTDVRDNWSYHFCRPEQAALIREVAKARLTNRRSPLPRSVVMIGGDLHAGALFDVTLSNPDVTIPSMVTSGISQSAGREGGIVGILVDEDFDVASGIHAKLKKFAQVYNFGVSQILFGGGAAMITNAVAHAGDNSYWSIRLPVGQK